MPPGEGGFFVGMGGWVCGLWRGIRGYEQGRTFMSAGTEL